MPALQQLPPIEIIDPKGLSLKVDIDSRDPSSFVTADNIDYYIQGSIRKVLPPLLYGVATPVNILAFLDYRQTDTTARQLVGVGTNGKLYDLTTGAQVGDMTAYVTAPLSGPVYLGMMPGTLIPYNFRSWQATTSYLANDAIIKYSYQDGNLYIYVVTIPGISASTESAYPKSGTVINGGVTWRNIGLQSSFQFAQNYLFIQVPGYQSLKWDGTTVTQVGVSAPGAPVNVDPVVISPNLNGYAPVSGSYACYTLYNPKTLHESSPSPLAGPTSFYAVDLAANHTVHGSLIPPLPNLGQGAQQQSYQQLRYVIPVSALTPAIGQGFTHVRIYRTKDAGNTPLLLQSLYDANGNLISNSDGSVPISVISTGMTDYVALQTPQSVQAVVSVYEGYGVPNLVPAPVTLDPNFWLDDSQGQIVTAVGAGQNNSNAFEYTGTGQASGLLIKRSIQVTLPAGTYVLKGFLDATAVAAGVGLSWALISGSGGIGVPVIIATQAPGATGYVTASAVCAAGTYWIGFFVQNSQVNLGSIAIGSDPVLQLGSVVSPTGYPTPDAALVTPAPSIDSAQPPPVGQWAAIYGGSIFVQDYDDRVKLWYDNPDDFESFGATSFIRFPSDTDDQIVSLLGIFQVLVIGKKRGIYQLQGQVPNFTPSPIDPKHGSLAVQGVLSLGSSFIALLNIGLSSIGLTMTFSDQNLVTGYLPEAVLGSDIDPLIKAIPVVARNNCVFAYDTTQDILIFAVPQTPGGGCDLVLLLSMAKPPKFSTYSALVTGRRVVAMQEVEFPDGSIGVLATCTDNKSYRLFGGTQDGTVTATVQSQLLPMPGQVPKESWGERKVFRMMWVDGQDLSNWRVSYSVDNGAFSVPQVLANQNLIGMQGKLLQIRLTHIAPTQNVPLLTYLNIDWDIIGKTR